MAISEIQSVAERPEGNELAGRVALVTGGTRGIGAAICRALAGHGASVAAGFSHDRERAEAFRAELAAGGADVTLHRGNVSSAEDCRRTVQEVVDAHGQIDILVNNAGITMDRIVSKMADADWYDVIGVNLSGTFFMSKAALEHMLERGSGRIINISSIIGQTGNVGQANYAASKSGLFGLTMSLAKEAAFSLKRAGRLEAYGAGITVNAVAPGFIETEMLDSVPEKALERIRSEVPLHRLGRPEEVARVVRFLAADASSYITGQVWAINGGQEM
ncbi:MAG TPA: beta-ketoacyl-ACP reductase [Baekduia sp.]|uniref:beta-ketoacyl-ACP reductase n=1 Tax=Baekduia sp. TaxID=2600305 RepID=UPI002CBB5FC6|nr:beta-ketoacyl-ACP reductase [Baekduia sp.]HMJ34263.1 beta-ketoacyl-ACP reductase [Baekduia sp.]